MKTLEITDIQYLTDSILQIRTTKNDLQYNASQAAKLSFASCPTDTRYLTITSIPSNDYVEFIIKTTASNTSDFHQALHQAKVGDSILIHEIVGGYKIIPNLTMVAGGVGITPFIAILRQLKYEKRLENIRLYWSNSYENHMFLVDELTELTDNHLFVKAITAEKSDIGYNQQFTAKQIAENSTDVIYICGSFGMIKQLSKELSDIADYEIFTGQIG